MKKLFTLLFISLITVSGFAYPWAHRYAAEQANQNIITDVNVTFTVAVEWGEGDWDATEGSMIGYGLTQDGSGWIWTDLYWFQDGDGSNKRCKNTISIATPGKYYYAYRLKKASNGGTSYSFGTDSWAENSGTLSPYSTIVVGKVSKADGDWATATNWEGDVAPVSTDNVVILHNISISSSETAGTLLINSGKSLTVNPGFSLTVSGNLTNNAGNNGLIVRSGGSLIHYTADIPGTMEREVANADWTNGMDGWHLISSPVENQLVTNGGFTSDPYDFYAWDEVTNTWLNQKEGANNITSFIPGKGYLVAYDDGGTKSFAGELNVTDAVFSNLSNTGSFWYTGFHLIGNPFASAIQWNNGSWNLNNVSGVASVWSETGQNYLSLPNANDIIPANQGFFVQVSNSTNSLTIPAAARTHSSTSFYKDAPADFLKFRISGSANETFDETIVRLLDNATGDYDLAYDGHKISGSSVAPQIYTSIASGEFAAVNSFSASDVPESVELGFRAGIEAIYTLTAIENTFNRQITLEDRLTGTSTDIGVNPEYIFTAQPGDDENRFVLHLGTQVGTGNAPVLESFNIYSVSGKLFISSPSKENLPVVVRNLTGSVVIQGVTNGNGISTIEAGDLAHGIYVVSIIADNQTVNKKVIIK